MATYDFKASRRQTIEFDPAGDVLFFPDGIVAAHVSLAAYSGGTIVSYGFDHVRLAGVSPADLDGTGFLFENGTVMLRGTAASDSLAGSEGADQFNLDGGGDDTLSAGAGDDRIYLEDSGLSPADFIDGGAGRRDILRLSGDYTSAVVLDASVVAGVERFEFGTGGTVRLQLADTLFGSDGVFSFTAAAQRSGDALFLDAAGVPFALSGRGGQGADTLIGGAAADHLTGGGGVDRLVGGAGDDRLVADRGADVLTGGAGADAFSVIGDPFFFEDPSRVDSPVRITDFNAAAGDRLTSLWSTPLLAWRGAAPAGFTAAVGQSPGGEAAGIDDVVSVWTAYDAARNQTILFGDRNGNGVVDADDMKILFDGRVALDASVFAKVDLVLVGTAGPDTGSALGLSNVADHAFGLDGNDSLNGLGGNDTLWGGGGADRLSGALGRDTRHGGRDDDVLMGGGGDDFLDGGTGADTLVGGAGNDRLTAAFRDEAIGTVNDERGEGNLLYGGSGNDSLGGDNGDDRLFGEDDSDDLSGAAGNDTLHGGEGADRLYGSTGDDELLGGLGDDSLEGGAGSDLLSGGAGNDTLVGGTLSSAVDAMDTLVGGGGRDWLRVRGGEPAVMTGGTGADSFILDLHWGSRFGEPVHITDFSTAQGDRLVTYLADGLLFGTPLVWRGEAAAGFTATEGQSMKLAGEDVAGAAFYEFWTIHDAAAKQTILFMDRNNDGLVDSGDFKIVFDGDIALSPESFSAGTIIARLGTAGADIMSAASGEDAMLFGGKGADTLNGSDGDDVLEGNQDDDVLSGGSGMDSLTGGQGIDTLTGGADADHFVIAFASHSTPAGFDVIADFVGGVDLIDLSQIDADAAADGLQHFTFIGSEAFGSDASGQLRYVYDGSTLMLYGSTDADAAAEIAVQVMGATALERGNLIL